MYYNFDKVIERFNTKCAKWDKVEELYGEKDVLPMWVADMDFEIPKPALDAIKRRAEHGIFGYGILTDSYYEAVINWMEKRHNWSIKKEWIKFTPGVVPGLNYIVKAFTRPGDEIIVQTPVYYPFYKVIKNNGANIVKNPLIYKNNGYTMDFDDLENKITARTRMLILCNPHNPVGRVWTKEELTRLGEICLKHNVLVVSDEIHFDLIYKDYEHTMFGSISEKFAQNSIICTAPSKTFNIAGLQTSNIIIPNDKLRNLFSIELENNAVHGPNVFGSAALEVVYNEGEEWLCQLLQYLEGNLNFLIEYFKEKIPKLKVIKPEGTYLVWFDCSELNMTADELRDFFVKKCKIGLDDGIMFGEEGAQFQRINIACPRSVLEDGLKRIEKAVNGL